MEYLIVKSEPLAEEAEAWLAAHADVRAVSPDAPDFRNVLREADALVVRTYTRVDASLLESATALRVIGRAGTGLDNVDLEACRRKGVQVVYTPHANTQAVVEYVLALIVDSVRPRRPITEAVTGAQWASLRNEAHAGRQMSDLTIGVLGLGRVGKRVAEVGRAFGSPVLYHDLLTFDPPQRFGATPVTAPELFERADILTVHIDGRRENRRFIDGRLLDRLRPNAVFINTSRGFVVDNVALTRFLTAHPDATAHLDVHDPEPFDDEYPLLAVPNARLYPHLASRTSSAMRAMSWVVRDVMAVLEGRAPRWSGL